MRGHAYSICAGFLLLGCGQQKAGSGNSLNADPVVAAREIAARCGLGGHIDFRSYGGRDLAIERIDPEADYGKVDCLLNGLRPLHLNVGFVGNEAWSPGSANAQAH